MLRFLHIVIGLLVLLHKHCNATDLFLEPNYFEPNKCEKGYFYIIGYNDSNYPQQCYPSLKDVRAIGDTYHEDFLQKIGSSNLGNVYFTEYMPFHPCYTSNPDNATLFVAIFWSNVWRYKSECISKLQHLVHHSPSWKDPKHHNHHIIHHFWGGSTLRQWFPALVSAKDCVEYDPPSIWVNADGEPYEANSTCHLNNPECGIPGSCEVSGEDRKWATNCSFINNCYLVVDRWHDRGLTSVYFENLDNPRSNLLPVVKPVEERQHIVVGAWGVKKKARVLRSRLNDAFDKVESAVFVHIAHDSNLFRGEIESIKNSTFCLVPKGDSPSRRGFSTCIILGSIPIVCSDHFIPPYHTIIDWKQVYFRIPERTCPDFLHKLHGIPMAKRKEMQENVLKVRETLFFRDRLEPEDGNKTLAELAVQAGGPLDMQVRYMFHAAMNLDKKITE